jgi:hypothetical protein
MRKYLAGAFAGNKVINEARAHAMRLLFLVCVLSFSSIARAQPVNNPPAFQGGAVQLIATCKNSGPMAINSQMAVTDADAGQTETWTVIMAPVHGIVAGFPVSALSTGGVVTPSGLVYTPAAGYSGADSFVIQVSDGISSAQSTIAVTVKAPPALTSSLTPPAICDQSIFSYVPASSPTGASVSWHRAYAPGIANPSASGTGNPNETLSNITNYDATVIYVFTLSANGCSSHYNVTVTVHPTPRLSGSLNDTLCSGGTFDYAPAIATPGTTFVWSRAAVAGIAPATSATGTGNISETLTNTTSSPVNVVYVFTLNDNGCNATRNLNLVVVPQPATALITATSAPDVCQGTAFQNFGAGTPPAPGTSYIWSTTNATIQAAGNTGQYILVSFPNVGDAAITLNTGSGVACSGTSTFHVTVGDGSLAAGTVIYYNYLFILQDNTQNSYQWGYDDAATLAPTVLFGATFQSYLDANPDFSNKYYWVMTTKGGCMQKTYFNTPATDVVSVKGGAALISITPNPATSMVRIELPVRADSKIKVVVTDMAGRVLTTHTGTGRVLQMNVAGMPAGSYLLNCFENELKIATSRFVKVGE